MDLDKEKYLLIEVLIGIIFERKANSRRDHPTVKDDHYDESVLKNRWSYFGSVEQ